MTNFISKHSNYNNFFTSVLLISFSYFIFHFLNGDHGLLSLIKVQKKVAEYEVVLDRVSSEKLNLAHKVSLLKESSLDIDMLDEQARRILGYSDKNERVLLRK